MYTSLEIEFKTAIKKDEYEKLIQLFNLENEIFTQTNYYFDTLDYSLLNKHVILRIREKAHNIKLTSKTPQDIGTLERHIILEKKEAYKMIKEGFNANIIGIDKNVVNVASLTTHRATTSYKKGKLFFDKNTYYSITDYEIEFEYDDEEKGKQIFLEFLKEHNIDYVKMESKSKRAFKKASE